MIDTGAIDRALRQAVAAGDVPGVVAVAADAQGVVYEGAFGLRHLEDGPAMTLDTVFWIASMTKAVTSVAALQLVERGLLELDAPIGALLPGLAAPQVLEGFDAEGAPRLRPARRPITLRHLLTHTAGFGYDIWNAEINRYMAATGLPPTGTGRLAALAAPLLFDPGERWNYGINTDWVGRAVEAASGRSLDVYFRERIFGPLGMTETGHVLRPEQRTRRAAMHQRVADGGLAPVAFALPEAPEFFSGSGGLHSTAGDYLRFARMILGRGRLDGAELLRPETVDLMATNQIGPLTVGRHDERAARALQPGRALPRDGQALGARLPDHDRGCALRARGRQPDLGGARQHLLLDRSRAEGHGRADDPDPAVRRSRGHAALRPLRARALRRARSGLSETLAGVR